MSLVFPALYAIITADRQRGGPLEWARLLAAAGVKVIQYRDKESSPRLIFAASCALAAASRESGFRLVLNDRPDIALLSGAGGVHVGQEDLPVEQARRICGTSLWIGVSTHTLEQVQQAGETSADYVAVGPVFPTATKKNPDPVVGLDFVRRARAMTSKPLVAIGGITAERAAEVFRAGADCIAVSSDLLRAKDPAKRAGEYLKAAEDTLGKG
jgi:thiamine-phosphate pyrophosphorylase